VLSARIVPDHGGETEFTSTRQAWRRLPPAMQIQLRDAIVTHALLAELIADATRPEFTYRHRWRPGDVIMWDNRATMHRGHPWAHDHARSMVRTTISAVDADGLADLRPGA
jgi:alpha-ketoglutarate-dependent taurine dioxygenase